MKLAQFLSLLSTSASPDYWSDVGIDDAIRIGNELTEADWREVRSQWHNYSTIQQKHLAETLSEMPNADRFVVPLLLELIFSCDPAIVEASLDSLNALAIRSPDLFVGTSLRERLDGIRIEGGLSQRLLESLRSRIATSP